MRAINPIRFLASALGLLLCGSSYSATMSEQLAERGHPNTELCILKKTNMGLNRVPVIQFEPQEDAAADVRKAVG